MSRLSGPLPLAIAVGLAMAALAVPYGLSVRGEYQRFHDYEAATTRGDPAALPWASALMSPEDCVTDAMVWADACPGVEALCMGALPDRMRGCIASQDRQPWCDEQGTAVYTTGLGYHDCEARLEGLEGRARKPVEKRCAGAWRALANHCVSLGQRAVP
jgi:hypothetical protein